jgi:hypothetical protein
LAPADSGRQRPRKSHNKATTLQPHRTVPICTISNRKPERSRIRIELREAAAAAQWYNTCLACVKPWVLASALQNK